MYNTLYIYIYVYRSTLHVHVCGMCILLLFSWHNIAILQSGVVPVSPTDEPVLVRGNLQKLGKRFKGWHQRYFEIQGSHMYYYKNASVSTVYWIIIQSTILRLINNNNQISTDNSLYYSTTSRGLYIDHHCACGGFYSFSLGLNFARYLPTYLLTCPLLLEESISPWLHDTVIIR